MPFAGAYFAATTYVIDLDAVEHGAANDHDSRCDSAIFVRAIAAAFVSFRSTSRAGRSDSDAGSDTFENSPRAARKLVDPHADPPPTDDD